MFCYFQDFRHATKPFWPTRSQSTESMLSSQSQNSSQLHASFSSVTESQSKMEPANSLPNCSSSPDSNLNDLVHNPEETDISRNETCSASTTMVQDQSSGFANDISPNSSLQVTVNQDTAMVESITEDIISKELDNTQTTKSDLTDDQSGQISDYVNTEQLENIDFVSDIGKSIEIECSPTQPDSQSVSSCTGEDKSETR